ncbi:hypothetical protein ACI7YQ_13370 [Alteromonas marina]|nr:hypothetical protein KUL113_38300 [Tenacibaculum sp. KUL113]
MDNKINNDEARRNARRKFLKRTSAGAILASLPAASVWGQDSLIAGSIAASGTGSDYAGGSSIALLSPGYWKNHTQEWGVVSITASYYSYTNSKPFGYGISGSLMKDSDGNVLSDTDMQNLTLLKILQNPGGGNGEGNIKGKFAGPGNINCYIAEMILNAANHGKTLDGQLINFPVLYDSANVGLGSNSGTPHRGLFPSLNAFANYLHTSAIGKETAMALELEALLNGNHA